jgi:hypothetical protein
MKHVCIVSLLLSFSIRDIEMWVTQNESGKIISYENVTHFEPMSCG